jgi:hypothetical protein
MPSPKKTATDIVVLFNGSDEIIDMMQALLTAS